MKKCQPLESSQHQNNQLNNIPKLANKPLNKVLSYELLLNEFFSSNPSPTDAELDQACLYFATKCGLTVAEKAKAKIGGIYD